MAVTSMMGVFRACRVPDRRLLGRLAARINSRSHDGQNSLVVGKNAGNFAESAFSCEHLSRKHLQIQLFMDEFPTQTSREFFCQRRELIGASREFGAKPIRAPRRIRWRPSPSAARAPSDRPDVQNSMIEVSPV